MPKTEATCWGCWEFDRALFVLRHVDGGGVRAPYGYEIDLEDCTTSAEVLDWIAQIEAKTWGTPIVVGHLVTALCDLLDPQARLCSWGQSKRIPKRELRALLLANERRTLGFRETRRVRAERSRLDRFRVAGGDAR
jgi:hypothetical protein